MSTKMPPDLQALLDGAEARMAKADARWYQAQQRHAKSREALHYACDDVNNLERPLIFASSYSATPPERASAERRRQVAENDLKRAAATLEAAKIENVAATKKRSSVLAQIDKWIYDQIRQEEERLQQKREREQTRKYFQCSTPSADPVKRSKPNRLHDWHQACTIAFEDKEDLRSFPQPPATPCHNPGCAVSAHSRALQACQCNIRKLFEGRSRAVLKTDRLLYREYCLESRDCRSRPALTPFLDPDKFSSVPEDVRDHIQQAAGEVFVVVDGMYSRMESD